MLGDMVKYFGSEWSFARYHVSEPNCICAFGTGADKHSIIGMHSSLGICSFHSRRKRWFCVALFLTFFSYFIFCFLLKVVCADGSYFKVTYDPEKGGECHRESYSKFLKMTDDD